MMNNARQILMQILAVIGSHQGKEQYVDDFLTRVQVQVMTALIGVLPPGVTVQVVESTIMPRPALLERG
jgi:hypothetical protein